MTGADDADRVLEAADAVGAPLSGLARVLMHHEASLDVTVPGLPLPMRYVSWFRT